MSPESAGKVSGAVTVNLTPQEWWDLQQAVKLLQQFEHSVATSLAPKTVNFDTLPNGGAITNGTDLTQNQPYSVWGVKFSVIPGPGPDVPPGGVFAVTAAMRRAAPMSARCSRLRSNRHSLMRRGRSRRRSAFRCMGSRSTSCQPQAARSSAWPRIQVYLKGFDAAGVQVAEATSMPGVAGDFGVQTLSISRSERDISSVEFSVAPDSNGSHRIFAEFDNLWFSQLV